MTYQDLVLSLDKNYQLIGTVAAAIFIAGYYAYKNNSLTPFIYIFNLVFWGSLL